MTSSEATAVAGPAADGTKCSPDTDSQLVAEGTSTMFQLQVAEVLKEVEMDYKDTAALDSVLHDLKTFIDALPPAQVTPSSKSMRKLLADLGVPKTTSLAFAPPASVSVVGSYLLKTLASPGLAVDLALELSTDMWREKDYRDWRYHAKRALYLAHLAKQLKKLSGVREVKFTSFCGDSRKPVLELVHESAPSFTLRLLPCLASSTFPSAKLGPARGNLRSLLQTKEETAADPGAPLPASPLYNNSILEDCCFSEDLRLLHAHLSPRPHLRQALVLLKVWASQRGLLSPSCLSGFLLSVLAVHLSAAGRLQDPGMSPSAHLKTLLGALANLPSYKDSSLFSSVLRLPEEPGSANLSMKDLRKAFPVLVVVGSNPMVNLAARMTASSLAEVASDAAATLHYMKVEGPNAVEGTFIQSYPPPVKFDIVMQLTLDKIMDESESDAGEVERSRVEERKVEDILHQALGDRVRLCRACPREERRSPLGRAPGQDAERGGVIQVHLALNSATAWRQVDVGPAGDSGREAEEWRAFWGDRSELRRFRDGTVCESVVWASAPGAKHNIVPTIARLALQRHLPKGTGVRAALSHFRCVLPALDWALHLDQDQDPDPNPGPQGLSGDLAGLQGASEALSKHLRSLPASVLPLPVTSAQSSSASLRGCAPLPACPHALAQPALDPTLLATRSVPKCITPHTMVLSLEGSGKWPDDPQAFQRTKTAFLLSIAQGLQAPEIGLHCACAPDHLDVLCEGYAFRLMLNTDSHEETSAPGALSASPGFLAQHAAMLQPLATTFPAYPTSVRLAQRWVSAHMFCPHLHPEAVEMLVAHIFSAPRAVPPPASPSCALLRFLELVALHPWAELPVILDPSSSFSAGAQAEVMHEFESLRQNQTGGPPMYLASPCDPVCHAWTHLRPCKPVLARLVSYARSSAQLLSSLIGDSTPHPTSSSSPGAPVEDLPAGVSALFNTPLHRYDILIHLNPAYLPLGLGRSQAGKRKRDSKDEKEVRNWAHVPASVLRQGTVKARKALLVGFNPVEKLIAELEAHLGGLMLFFADTTKGEVLGAMLRPHACNPTTAETLKLGIAGHMMPVDSKSTSKASADSNQLILNMPQILHEISMIGKGLVVDVQLQLGSGNKSLKELYTSEQQ